jgi:transcriptional regulator with XRE-family HTH domain
MKDKDKRRLQKFAAHLAKLREEKGLSQRGLSSRCEVDFGKISKIENNKANLVVTTLIELADGLGVHPRELLNIDFD